MRRQDEGARDVPVGIPWYVHPAESPRQWRALSERVVAPSFAVFNVANGPGRADDPYYPPAVAQTGSLLHLGYIDIAYGRRAVDAVVCDALAWRSRYGSRGVMLDQVPADRASRDRVLRYTEALRAVGAGVIAGNPGTVADIGIMSAFDIVCVVEESAETYLTADFPTVRPSPRTFLWHLVHTCPPALRARVGQRAARSNADFLFVTEQTLPHPWGGFDDLRAPDVSSVTGHPVRWHVSPR